MQCPEGFYPLSATHATKQKEQHLHPHDNNTKPHTTHSHSSKLKPSSFLHNFSEKQSHSLVDISNARLPKTPPWRSQKRFYYVFEKRFYHVLDRVLHYPVGVQRGGNYPLNCRNGAPGRHPAVSARCEFA
jgi:hypothetical protein